MNQPNPALTDQQLCVLRLIAAGHTSDRIAEELHVSYSTVKTHVEQILQRLDAHSRAQAVHIAHQRGLLGGGQ